LDARFLEQLARGGDSHGVQQDAVTRDLVLLLDASAGKRPDIGRKTAFLRAANHQHFHRIVAQQQHASRWNRLYFCHPTHSSPPGPRSFFQIGTVCLNRSITMRQTSKASPRCGEEHAITMEASPTFRMPRRCSIATATCGNCALILSSILVISFSAMGRYAS